jgi:hypothetical protein
MTAELLTTFQKAYYSHVPITTQGDQNRAHQSGIGAITRQIAEAISREVHSQCPDCSGGGMVLIASNEAAGCENEIHSAVERAAALARSQSEGDNR